MLAGGIPSIWKFLWCAEYVKMYGIFMGQLQVGLIFVTCTEFLFIWFYSEHCGWLCDNVLFNVEHTPAYHKYTWGICKWLYQRTSCFVFFNFFFYVNETRS
jgi:hypothetical protein